MKETILRLDNGMELLLDCARVLAIIPKRENFDDRVCGINVSLEFSHESEEIEEFVLKEIHSGDHFAKGTILINGNKIPVDIHGGNAGEAYFGYVNPTLFN